MKIRLVFDDWRNKQGESVYQTGVGIELSMGSLHSGSTFTAEVQFAADTEEDLRESLAAGYTPVFYVSAEA